MKKDNQNQEPYRIRVDLDIDGTGDCVHGSRSCNTWVADVVVGITARAAAEQELLIVVLHPPGDYLCEEPVVSSPRRLIKYHILISSRLIFLAFKTLL